MTRILRERAGLSRLTHYRLHDFCADFDLVKIYHPDSAQGRHLPPNVRHARFQSITHAYDVLRGKSTVLHARGDSFHDPVRWELERRRRHGPSGSSHPRSQTSTAGSRGWGARHFAHDFPWASDAEWSGRKDKVEGWNDQWKDKVIVCVAVLVRPPFFIM